MVKHKTTVLKLVLNDKGCVLLCSTFILSQIRTNVEFEQKYISIYTMRRDSGHHNINLDKQTSNSLILKNEVIVWMHLRSLKNQYLWCLYMVVHEFPPPNFTWPDWKPIRCGGGLCRSLLWESLYIIIFTSQITKYCLVEAKRVWRLGWFLPE